MALNISGVDVTSGLGIPFKPLIPSVWDVLPEAESLPLLKGFMLEKGYQTTLPLALTHCGNS